MKLFIDSDILLDAVLLRSPYDKPAAQVLSLIDRKDHTLCASAHSLLNVYYFTRKEAGKKGAVRAVSLLEEKLEVLPTNREAVHRALTSDFADIEDAVQHALAMEYACKVIITRNLKDYRKAVIPVMTAGQYLTAMSAGKK